MTSFELVVCLVLILMSAFLSSSELALFSLSRFDLRSLKDKLRPAAHRNIKRLLADPGGLLITILVLNEIINISLSTLITQSVVKIFPQNNGWILDFIVGILITTPLILVFCEITPKVIGARANQLIAALNSNAMATVYDLTGPVRFVLQGGVSLFSGASRLSGAENQKDTVVKESDFLMMMEEGRKEGAIQQNEFELIKNVFELDDTVVEDVYTPHAQVKALSEVTSLREALILVRNHDFSRIPVHAQNNRRHFIGILYAKDLLRAKLQPELQDMKVSSLIRKPLYVQSSLRLNAVFRKFKQQRTHMAIVQRPNGECLGIITMKDVLDALFDDLIPGEVSIQGESDYL